MTTATSFSLNSQIRGLRPLAMSALLVVLAAAPALSQRQELRRSPGPPIAALEVHIEDLSSGQVIATVSPRDTLEVEEGLRLRLRMVGLPAGQNRSARYPSTRFWMAKNSRQVEVERTNEQVGAIIVRTVRPHQGPGAAPILFEITDSMQIDTRERTGRVYLKVVPKAAATPPPRDDRRRDDRGRDDRRREARGVTLYEDAGFRGRNQRVTVDLNDLRGTVIGNDRATSIRVDPGCEAVLYEDIEYRGRSAVVRGDAPAIDDLGIGNDTLSSIRVICGDRRQERGVVLYDGVDFSGNYEFFSSDDPGLGDNVIGNDRVRSVQVDPGCPAVLYRDANYRGGSFEVTRDLVTLNGTPVGNDGATSIRVRCGRR